MGKRSRSVRVAHTTEAQSTPSQEGLREFLRKF
jgi:hypothetical protein